MWLLRFFHPIYRTLRSLALPLSSVLSLFKRQSETAAGAASEEKTEEEMQAYLNIGEDEGILEEEDTKLIQSVVEFGDTLVREVMTPRTRDCRVRRECDDGRVEEHRGESSPLPHSYLS